MSHGKASNPRNPRTPHIPYVPLIVFLLLACSLFVFSPPATADDDGDSGAILGMCRGTTQVASALLLPAVAVHDINLDGDPDAEFQSILRMITGEWSGDIQGRGTGVQLVLSNLDDGVATVTALANLAVSVCGSDPGTMSVLFTLIIDAQGVEGKLTVIEGSGMRGLEGICGGASLESGSTTWQVKFRFGRSCRSLA